MANGDESVRATCPRGCYDGCGIIVRKRDGGIVKVKGNREHPISRGRLCPKSANGYIIWVS